MTNDEEQFLNDVATELDARNAASLKKLRRQLRAAEAYEKRVQQSRKQGYLEGLRDSLSREDSKSTADKFDYPSWAPSSLCNRLFLLKGELGNALNQSDYVDALDRLCTDNRMKEIWHWLEKNFKPSNEVSNFDVLAYRFSRSIYSALYGMKSWSSLTKKQGEKKIDEIIKLIGKLTKLLDGYPVSDGVLADFKAEEFSSLQTGLVRHVLQNVSSKLPDYFFEKIEDAAYDTPVNYEDLYLPSNPTLNELLGRVESRLREINFTSISTNGSDSSRSRYFLRTMASFMTDHYGSRKDAQLAKIGNVFFSDELDEKRVADLFRGRP